MCKCYHELCRSEIKMNKKWKELETSCSLKVIFWLFTLVFLVAAIASPDRAELFSGLKAIYTTPAQVTKDYFEVGSVSAAFMNAFLVSALCAGLYMLPGAVANGVSFLAFSLTAGFSFWGMNVEGLPVTEWFWFPIVLSAVLCGVAVIILRSGKFLK